MTLIACTSVLKDYLAAMADKAELTLFAPNDAAFHAKGRTGVDATPGANVVVLLRYHVLPGYNPRASLKVV